MRQQKLPGRECPGEVLRHSEEKRAYRDGYHAEDHHRFAADPIGDPAPEIATQKTAKRERAGDVARDET